MSETTQRPESALPPLGYCRCPLCRFFGVLAFWRGHYRGLRQIRHGQYVIPDDLLRMSPGPRSRFVRQFNEWEP